MDKFISFEHFLRKQLDSRFAQRNILVNLLMPLLLVASCFVSFISMLKKKFFLKKNSDDWPMVLTIGNVIVGGTGKTPVVQALALSFLRQGFDVAIASRGIKKNQQQAFFYESSLLEELSDENREHFEILSYFKRKKDFSACFYIFQGKNRGKSLADFKSLLSLKKVSYQKAVFLIDDGLQYYACPRNVSLCLWSPDILVQAPPFAIPLGPYREGFGFKGLQNALVSSDYRLWSRWHPSSVMLSDYKQNIMQALEQYHLTPDAQSKDIL
ncbi:MAG: tetraacyldisaccharide 4'-kinase, partial [Silvanigrellaceae bacterium]|nr:tetraacyldisaccharide 4'-kinase [Silvanigrellaceae bacterium]